MIYNIMAIGIPFIYVGPAESHIIDLIDHAEPDMKAFVAVDGDVDAVVGHILASSRSVSLRSLEAHSPAARFSKEVLSTRMVELLEKTEDRSQKSGARSQETGVRSQKSGDRSQESGDRIQNIEDRGSRIAMCARRKTKFFASELRRNRPG